MKHYHYRGQDRQAGSRQARSGKQYGNELKAGKLMANHAVVQKVIKFISDKSGNWMEQ